MRAEPSIRGSEGPHTSECASGAGHAPARSSFRTCSSKPPSTTGRARRSVFVGLLSSFGTWTAMRFVTASSAQPAPAAAKPLLVQPLSDLPGREVRITLLDRAPGSSSPPHRHPGHHTFGYVVEGTYEFAIDGQPGRILNAVLTYDTPTT